MCVTLKNLTGRELTLYSLEGDRPLVTLTVDGPQPLTTSIFAPTGGEIEGIPTVRLADKVELNLDLAPQPSYRPQPAPAHQISAPTRPTPAYLAPTYPSPKSLAPAAKPSNSAPRPANLNPQPARRP
jgi:hypothetical protein